MGILHLGWYFLCPATPTVSLFPGPYGSSHMVVPAALYMTDRPAFLLVEAAMARGLWVQYPALFTFGFVGTFQWLVIGFALGWTAAAVGRVAGSSAGRSRSRHLTPRPRQRPTKRDPQRCTLSGDDRRYACDPDRLGRTAGGGLLNRIDMCEPIEIQW